MDINGKCDLHTWSHSNIQHSFLPTHLSSCCHSVMIVNRTRPTWDKFLFLNVTFAHDSYNGFGYPNPICFAECCSSSQDWALTDKQVLWAECTVWFFFWLGALLNKWIKKTTLVYLATVLAWFSNFVCCKFILFWQSILHVTNYSNGSYCTFMAASPQSRRK